MDPQLKVLAPPLTDLMCEISNLKLKLYFMLINNSSPPWQEAVAQALVLSHHSVMIKSAVWSHFAPAYIKKKEGYVNFIAKYG